MKALKNKWFWLIVAVGTFAFLAEDSSASGNWDWVQYVPGLSLTLDMIRSAIIAAFEAIKFVAESVYGTIFTGILSSLDWTLGALLGSDVQARVSAAMYTANYWFPLTEMAIALTAFYSIKFSLISLRWILKFVPTID